MARVKGYLTAESKHALREAVVAIELASGAEVVVVMRPASVPAQVPCALAALLSGLLGLAFLMFSPWLFSHEAIWLDTLVCEGVGALLCFRFVSVRRLFTPRKLASELVTRAAMATFVERGVCETRDRGGLLVYVSQIERTVALVADRGIRERVEPEAWKAAVARVEACGRRYEDGVKLAECLRELSPLLASALPRRADDINELDDVVGHA